MQEAVRTWASSRQATSIRAVHWAVDMDHDVAFLRHEIACPASSMSCPLAGSFRRLRVVKKTYACSGSVVAATFRNPVSSRLPTAAQMRAAVKSAVSHW